VNIKDEEKHKIVQRVWKHMQAIP